MGGGALSFKTHPNLPLKREGTIRNAELVSASQAVTNSTTYSIQNPSRPSLKKGRRVAFTLAEVLITLGIIGVVSALTLPSVIQKYNETVWINKFKQTYSELSQLFISVIDENGGVFPEDICDGITNRKECSGKIANLLIDSKKNIHKVEWQSAITYYHYDIRNKREDMQMYRGGYTFLMLNNGAVIGIGYENPIFNADEPQKGVYFPHMFIDLNGKQKPNKLGYDQFLIYLKKYNGKYTISGYDMWWVSPRYCNPFRDVSGWTHGGACAIWMINHGNMDYLHKEITSW